MTRLLRLHAVLPAGVPPPALRPRLVLVQAGAVAGLASRGATADGPAHAAICDAAAPCLPLPAGTEFEGVAELRAWLHRRQAPLLAALETAGFGTEWLVTLAEEAESHAAWLTANDPGLARLAASATPQRLAEAQAKARAARTAFIHARLEGVMAWVGAAAPARGPGHWTVTIPAGAEAALRRALAQEAMGLVGTGLRLDLSGPSLPFAYGRLAGLDS